MALQAPEPHPLGVGRQWYDLQPIDWTKLPAARVNLRERLNTLGESVPLGRTTVLGFPRELPWVWMWPVAFPSLD
ncbi:hypothetical protein [Cyanobium sp. ATX-6F1]|uniref:hypothetical protein n=1 Tax=Cyanobium sp. ATX-6F1 TaxID=3137388 RepID=UPI0039BDC483